MIGDMISIESTMKVNAPKLKEFKGVHLARDVDTFFLELNSFFVAIGIKIDAANTCTIAMYLTDIAMLW